MVVADNVVKRAVIFDLDDTLYAEQDFVHSGFRAVANWADGELGIPAEAGYEQLARLFAAGVRGTTFNRWLAMWSIEGYSLTVSSLVEVYRSHKPEIKPFNGVRTMLDKLSRNYRLGLLSDGYLDVQRRKLEALDLAGEFDAVVFSDEWGRSAWKPDTRPFEAICDRLTVAPLNAVYAGDNPTKDFAGARAIGMKAIWVKRAGGEYTGLQPPSPAYAPSLTIQSLGELPGVLKDMFKIVSQG